MIDNDEREAADDAAATDTAAEEKKRDTQAQQLAKISTAAGLFHTPNGTGYADISIGGHRETWPIRSKGFRNWLLREFYKSLGSVPSSNAIGAGPYRGDGAFRRPRTRCAHSCR